MRAYKTPIAILLGLLGLAGLNCRPAVAAANSLPILSARVERLRGQLFALNGATIENRSAGVFELLGDFGVLDPTSSGGQEAFAAAPVLPAAIAGAPPVFNNAGILRKIQGTGESVFQRIMVINLGLVDIRIGIRAIKMAQDGGGGQTQFARPRRAQRPGAGGSRRERVPARALGDSLSDRERG